MKKLIFSLLAVCISCVAFSQNFMQGVGINVILQSTAGFKADPVGSIIYSPRVSFMEDDNSSLSVGIPMSFGVSGSYNSQNTDANNIGLVFDVPVMFDYNYGAGSSRESEDKFGFFGGLGFGYHANQYYATDAYGYDYSDKMSGFGPVGNIGARLAVGHGSHNLEIRFSYMKTMDISKSNVMGIGALFNF
jgi:hypothetical protein